MKGVRILGWILTAIALGLLAREGIDWLLSGSWVIASGADLWAGIDSESLTATGNFIARSLSRDVANLFDKVMGWPAWATIGGLGLILLAIAHRRRNGRGRRYFKS